MKKIIIFLLVISLSVLVGCSKNTAGNTSLEDQYYNYAQECIENGENEKAISALEEGIEKTGSVKLNELLETLKPKESDASSKNDSDDSFKATSSDTTVFDKTSSKARTESSGFKIPDEFIMVFNSTREELFGSKPYDFTTQGNECYYSGDKSFVVYYLLDGSPSEKSKTIQGEISALIPGQSIYTADEIQSVFSGYECERFYSEIDECYQLYVKYENYDIGFSTSSMNSYTSFSLTKINLHNI